MSSWPLTWRRSRLSAAIVAVLALLVGLIVVAGPAQRAAAATPDSCGVPGNLVRNCGFEAGDLAGWQLTPADSGSGAGVVKAGRSGYYSAHFAATGASDDRISQSIAGTRPGWTYVVQFWLRNHDTTRANHFFAQVTGKKTVTLLDQTNADPFGWTLFTGKFVAGSSAPTLTLGGRSAQNSILVDDVTVAATNDCREVPGNLVVNCGFERRLASWLLTPAGNGKTAGAISTPHSGVRSAYFTAGGSTDDQISQTLSGTIPGSTYLVQFWVRNEAPTTGNHFRAQVGDTADGMVTLLEQTDAAPYNFTLFTGSFVAGTGAPTLTFAGRNSTTFYLDDVSVVREAPMPDVGLRVRPHALVATVASGNGTPTGTVTFAVDGTSVGTAPLSAGKATLHDTVPTGAARKVTATYSGDNNFAPASASVIRRDPTITARVTSAHRKTRAGWYRSPISVRFACTTHGAPLTRPCPAPVTITRNGAHQAVTRTIRATDGGADTVRVTGLNLDRTAPRVGVRGVRNGGVYAGHAPRAICVAHDRLSGVASCRIRRHAHLTVTRYTAVATDRAGNRSTVTGRYRVAWMFLAGTRYANHAWQVRLGHSYRLVVTHRARRPRYVAAAPWPRKPSGTAYPMTTAGTRRWAITISVPRGLGHHRSYSLGVLAGGKLHRLRFRTR